MLVSIRVLQFSYDALQKVSWRSPTHFGRDSPKPGSSDIMFLRPTRSCLSFLKCVSPRCVRKPPAWIFPLNQPLLCPNWKYWNYRHDVSPLFQCSGWGGVCFHTSRPPIFSWLLVVGNTKLLSSLSQLFIIKTTREASFTALTSDGNLPNFAQKNLLESRIAPTQRQKENNYILSLSLSL